MEEAAAEPVRSPEEEAAADAAAEAEEEDDDPDHPTTRRGRRTRLIQILIAVACWGAFYFSVIFGPTISENRLRFVGVEEAGFYAETTAPAGQETCAWQGFANGIQEFEWDEDGYHWYKVFDRIDMGANALYRQPTMVVRFREPIPSKDGFVRIEGHFLGHWTFRYKRARIGRRRKRCRCMRQTASPTERWQISAIRSWARRYTAKSCMRRRD